MTVMSISQERCFFLSLRNKKHIKVSYEKREKEANFADTPSAIYQFGRKNK